MVAAAPSIMLIVLKRLSMIARKMKLTCADVPRFGINFQFEHYGGRFNIPYRSLIISRTVCALGAMVLQTTPMYAKQTIIGEHPAAY
jgi:hypothetical protein